MDANANANEAENELQVLTDTLIGVVGLTAQQANFVINQGIRSASLLARLDDDSFKELMERPTLSNIIITTKMRFRAMRIWLQEQKMAHNRIELANFTDAKCDSTLDDMAKLSSFRGDSKRSSQKDVKPPEKFSGRVKSWKAWRAEFHWGRWMPPKLYHLR